MEWGLLLGAALLGLIWLLGERAKRAVRAAHELLEAVPLKGPLKGAFAAAYREVGGWARAEGFRPAGAFELRYWAPPEGRREQAAVWISADGTIVLVLYAENGRTYIDFQSGFFVNGQARDLTTSNAARYLKRPCVPNPRFRLEVYPKAGLVELYARHRRALGQAEAAWGRPLAIRNGERWLRDYLKRRAEELGRCPFGGLRALWRALSPR